eukprot:1465613-Pleurochrysis_carterae.AAC.1
MGGTGGVWKEGKRQCAAQTGERARCSGNGLSRCTFIFSCSRQIVVQRNYLRDESQGVAYCLLST